MREEFLDPNMRESDDDLVEPELDPESGLRPQALDEFVGQTELKEHLNIVLEAARKRGQSVDHLLFAGPPGLGKTTLAGIIATEMGVHLHVTSGPALERAGDLAAILTKLEDGDVLFIDEIHRLSRAVEEILYPAMEDFQLDIVVGKGPAASSIRLTMPPFTLVGATTRTGMITGPLRDRFGLVARLDYYDTDELRMIVERAAGIFEIEIDTDGAQQIARQVARHPAHRQPVAAPRPRLRRGARRRCDHRRGGQRGPRTVRSRRSRPRQGRPSDPVQPLQAVRGWTGRALHARDQHRRAARDRRGRLRAVPHHPGHDRPHTRGRVALAAAYEHVGLRPPATDRSAEQRLFDA